MAYRSRAARRHADLAGIGFSVSDELGNRASWYRWIHHHNVRLAADGRDRRDVPDEIEIEFVVEQRAGYGRCADKQERITSGAAFATASVPIVVPAPGLFSMTKGWPSRSDSHSPIRRAMMSYVPLGAAPTMMRTGRAGYACAL